MKTSEVIAICIAFVVVLVIMAGLAHAHEIYTGVHGKDGQLCCGGFDCAVTTYREHEGHIEFLTREGEWVEIPEDRITYLPIPGDTPASSDYHATPNGDELHRAHMCYRMATDSDRANSFRKNVFGSIYLYCAFITPGAT